MPVSRVQYRYASGAEYLSTKLKLDKRTARARKRRSYIIEQARLLRQKTENRYLAVLVAARGVNRCRKALFGAASRPDTPTALLGGETVEH